MYACSQFFAWNAFENVPKRSDLKESLRQNFSLKISRRKALIQIFLTFKHLKLEATFTLELFNICILNSALPFGPFPFLAKKKVFDFCWLQFSGAICCSLGCYSRARPLIGSLWTFQGACKANQMKNQTQSQNHRAFELLKQLPATEIQ